MTAHAAKGLEWDVVVVAGVQDGVWPDLRVRGSLLGIDDLIDVVETGDVVPGSRIPSLLDEERRLFYVACTRAREQLVVTAVRDNDEGAQPSRFVTELPLEPDSGHQVVATTDTGQRDESRQTTLADLRTRVPVPELLRLWDELVDDEAQPATTRTRVAQLRSDAHDLVRSLDLASLVAELRSVAGDGSQPLELRRGAAAVLALLAADEVPAASPQQWYAVAGLSDDRPMRDPGESVRVSPSKVESFAKCGLRWLLESVGADGAPGSAQSIGSLIHDLAELAASDPTPSVEDLMSRVDESWDEMGLESPWYSRKQRERAQRMLDQAPDLAVAQSADPGRDRSRVRSQPRPGGAHRPGGPAGTRRARTWARRRLQDHKEPPGQRGHPHASAAGRIPGRGRPRRLPGARRRDLRGRSAGPPRRGNGAGEGAAAAAARTATRPEARGRTPWWPRPPRAWRRRSSPRRSTRTARCARSSAAARCRTRVGRWSHDAAVVAARRPRRAWAGRCGDAGGCPRAPAPPDAGTIARDRASGAGRPAGARPDRGRCGLRQDGDDGVPRRLARRQRHRAAGTRARAHLHEEGSRGAGRPGHAAAEHAGPRRAARPGGC